MAASVTLQSTTLEGQLIEVAVLIQNAELALPIETRPDNIQITPDIEGGTITVTFSVPATATVNATGNLTLVPSTYLP